MYIYMYIYIYIYLCYFRYCGISFIAVVCLMHYFVFNLIWYFINHSTFISCLSFVAGGGRWWWWLETPGGHGRPQRTVAAHRFWPGTRNLVLQRRDDPQS